MNLWKWMIVTSFLFVTCAFLSVPAIGQGKPTQDVNVVNTPSVNVTNTPTVSLQAGATINVTNPLDSQNNPTPLAMLEAMKPYEDTCSYSIGSTQACSFQQVPPGKRLVIQEFDVAQSTPLQPLSVTLNTGTIVHAFPATSMGNDGNGYEWFVTHQETRLYVQGGNNPACSVTYPNAKVVKGSGWVVSCSLSGFLVDQ